ncbi:OLC1v1029232C1 [Oldenlandia corymbosa var. corymbosa]|uniref:OLC1v1029232C1 n=1 Tax=Oldenlandia corymbosa var. corymbosa TaxID=529605 RepID=A0AAV1CFG7_OLDCO|nr:OLC1v1029232C1 [Oldenlandia corymbosa var. corymbosa]
MATTMFPSPKSPLLQPLLPSSSTHSSTASLMIIRTIPIAYNLRRTHHLNTPFASFRNSSIPPESSETGECPVPQEQQPINEFKSLSTSFPFSWASADLVEYCSRLFVTGAGFSLLVGVPVSWFGTIGPESDPIKVVTAGVSSGILVATLLVVRMYLGWAYVGNRLLSATVEYEETGWYDGQMWVKTAEVLARDRLLGSFSVKPVLNRLKNTLVTLAISLVICVLVFLNAETSHKDAAYMTSEESGGRAVPGAYNDESARTFEPDAFCGEPAII